MSFLKSVYQAALELRFRPIPKESYDEAVLKLDQALSVVQQRPPMPKIVCLCGSTKFKKEFEKANLDLTKEGVIVLTVGSFTHADTGCSPEQHLGEDVKRKLDQLHKRKIDLADEVYVLNVNSYIGSSTWSEIIYARSLGKPVVYLNPF